MYLVLLNDGSKREFAGPCHWSNHCNDFCIALLKTYNRKGTVIMKNGVKFICYGESIENLKLSIEFNVIGTPNRTCFEEDEEVFLAVKVKGLWMVCGKASISHETEINPFEKYYTYSTDRLITCKPFSINTISKKILGNYWGLMFQRPKRIINEKFYEYIQNNFIEVTPDEMIKQLA